MSAAKRHLGSSLDDFLWQEGPVDEVRSAAIKETAAFQGQKSTEAGNIHEAEMAPDKASR